MDDTAAAGRDSERSDKIYGEVEDALTVAPAHPQGTDDENSTDSARVAGHWRYELRRWLATLNPGRTGREYEKAVSYFFLTRGVPGRLSEVTFDLLLAYRGALALRATPTERGGAYTARMPLSSAGILNAPAHDALPGPADSAADTSGQDDDGHDTPASTGLLAPATVNIRLTALRQFLVHCSMMGNLAADLAPDRIRMALKRLQIDRRRPYQVLAESEWQDFLAAAALLSDSAAHRDGQDRPRANHMAEATRMRNHALIALALTTGLRAIELTLLNLGDVSREWHDGHEEWWLVLPDEKSKGQHGGRALPLAPELVETLMNYVRSTGRRWENPSDRSSPLFLSRQSRAMTSAKSGNIEGYRNRLSTVQIRRIVDRVEQQWLVSRTDPSAASESGGRAAGETRVISPHALRHSTAVALLEGNASIGRPPASVEHVRGWLGHLDIRTTQGYLAHLESRRHRRALALGGAMLPSQVIPTDHTKNEAKRASQEAAAQPDEAAAPSATSRAANGTGATTTSTPPS